MKIIHFFKISSGMCTLRSILEATAGFQFAIFPFLLLQCAGKGPRSRRRSRSRCCRYIITGPPRKAPDPCITTFRVLP